MATKSVYFLSIPFNDDWPNLGIGNFDRVAPPGQRVYPNSDSDEEDDNLVSNSVLQNAANANRFQYKTPNLDDRLKNEQLHEEMKKVQYKALLFFLLFLCIIFKRME